MIEKNKIPLKKRKIIFIILIVFIFALSIFLFLTVKSFFNVLEKKVIYAEVLVGDKYGFDINDTALKFGMIIPGASSSFKTMNLSNYYNREVAVEIYAKGKIKPFITVSENDFVLRKNEIKKIGFVVSVPENIEFGKYDGRVVILIREM